MLGAAAVHPINFQMKRAHLRILAFGREALTKIKGMTPARFDLLYAVRRAGVYVRQAELPHILGVSRQTVSRMLDRLEEMNWIERRLWGRRSKQISLTEEGTRKIRRAMRLIFRGRIFLRLYERLLDGERPQHVLALVADGWSFLDHVARGLGDRSDLWYDFGLGPYAEPPRYGDCGILFEHHTAGDPDKHGREWWRRLDPGEARPGTWLRDPRT